MKERKHIKDFDIIEMNTVTLLKEGKEPEKNSMEEKLLKYTNNWYTTTLSFSRKSTFKKISNSFYNKCTGDQVDRINQMRNAMINVRAEFVKQLELKKKRNSEAIQRVAWEVNHDQDQADEIFNNTYLKKFSFFSF